MNEKGGKQLGAKGEEKKSAQTRGSEKETRLEGARSKDVEKG